MIIPENCPRPSPLANPTILDSGNRTEYSTGAVRDLKEGKGRFDLMPMDVLFALTRHPFYDSIDSFKKTATVSNLYSAIEHAGLDCVLSSTPYGNYMDLLLDVSKHFEEGANKYGPNNWQKGIPIHSYIDSACRHYTKYIAGWDDEPHLRACIWNLMCCAWTMINMPDMDDYTDRRKSKEVKNDN